MASDREYRIAPELRRCCWYVIVGVAVVSGVAVVVGRRVQDRSAADLTAVCTMFALIAVAMIVALRWRVRIDGAGVSRRLFWGWSLWPWGDLASGRIRKLHPHTLYDLERPWLRRKLRLGAMASGDLREVWAAINEHYRLPPPPDVPERITIRYGFRRTMTLDAKGLHLVERDQTHEYLWNEVRRVLIVLMDPLRRDFRSLTIVLPDREIELKLVTHQGGTTPTWRGATAEELNEACLRYVPPERIDVAVWGEGRPSREHIERKLASARKAARDMRIVLTCFAPVVLGFFVWAAIDDGLLRAALMMAGVAPPMIVIVALVRQSRRQVAALEAELLQA